MFVSGPYSSLLLCKQKFPAHAWRCVYHTQISTVGRVHGIPYTDIYRRQSTWNTIHRYLPSAEYMEYHTQISTVGRVHGMSRVARSLSHRQSRWIRFPSKDATKEHKNLFFTIAGFPKGEWMYWWTHDVVPIRAPNTNEHDYVKCSYYQCPDSVSCPTKNPEERCKISRQESNNWV